MMHKRRGIPHNYFSVEAITFTFDILYSLQFVIAMIGVFGQANVAVTANVSKIS